MTVIGLDHVQLAAPPGCEAEARRFFEGLLGLAEPQQLHVGVEETFAPAGKAHPALRITPGRLHALADRLTSAGAEVNWDRSLPGVLRFFTSDPWGNRLELLCDEEA